MASKPPMAGKGLGTSITEVGAIVILFGCCAVLGLLLDLRWLTIGTTYALLALVVSGNEAIWGLGGLPSLGYNGFLGVGAYTAGILAIKAGFSPAATIPFSVLVAVGCAVFLWPFVSR